MSSESIDAHRVALLKAAELDRFLSDALEASARQHEYLIQSASEFSLPDEELWQLRKDSAAMQAQAAKHRAQAAQSEWSVGLMHRPSLQPEGSQRPDAKAFLTTAAAITATVLPGGWALGAATVTAAPYLGLDFGGKARARVRATLRRDLLGRFNFTLREDNDGVYIGALLASDIDDDRGALRDGDRVRSLDRVLVRAVPPMHADEFAVQDAEEAARAAARGEEMLSFEEAKRHVRDSGDVLVVEVFRRAVRPATERLMEHREQISGDVSKVLAVANPVLNPVLEPIKQQIAPHLERFREQAHQQAQQATGQVQQAMEQWQEEQRRRASLLLPDRSLIDFEEEAPRRRATEQEDEEVELPQRRPAAMYTDDHDSINNASESSAPAPAPPPGCPAAVPPRVGVQVSVQSSQDGQVAVACSTVATNSTC